MTDSQATSRAPSRPVRLAALILLFGATLALYWNVRDHHFVSFDDPIYVTENPHLHQGLSRAGIEWAFTTFRGANWTPITWLSHLLDYQLYGLQNPGGHHFTSALLHALAALLLALALARLTRTFWPSFVVALLFAVHPLRVESVAWVSERKDVLCGLFFIAALLAYGSYARGERGRRAAAYVLLYVCFAACLMSKSMGVTLPFVLLLLDRWPLDRARHEGWLALVIEKLPLFLLSIGVSVLAYVAQEHSGAVTGLERLPVSARLTNLPLAYAHYLQASLWPANLACFYPHPHTVPTDALGMGLRVSAAIALLIAITCFALALRARVPQLIVGWLWFAGMLIPVIGLVQVGLQARADRYTYLPSIGFNIALVWGGLALARRMRTGPALPFALAAALALALGLASRKQITVWSTTQDLFAHAVRSTQGNYVAHNNLGVLLESEGDAEGASAQYSAALEARPQHVSALNNLGRLRYASGDNAGARVLFERALAGLPDPSALSNLGAIELDLKNSGSARDYFLRALDADPNCVDALRNLASMYGAAFNTRAAIPYIERLLAIQPRNTWAHHQIGVQMLNENRIAEAIVHFERAVQLEPNATEARLQLARLADREGHPDQAIAHYESAIARAEIPKPERAKLAHLYLDQGDVVRAVESFRAALVGGRTKNAQWANSLAQLLCRKDESVRNIPRALAWARIAASRTDFKRWDYLTTLAEANAAAGQWRAAFKWLDEAIALAPAENRPQLLHDREQLGEIFDAR